MASSRDTATSEAPRSDAARLIDDYFAASLRDVEREYGASAAAHARRLRQARRTWQADGDLDPVMVMGLRAWITNRALAAPPTRRKGALADRDAVLRWLDSRRPRGEG